LAESAQAAPPSPPIIDALLDDLNTPQMIATLHGLRQAAAGSETSRAEFVASLRLVGFLSETANQWRERKQKASGIDVKKVEQLIAERTAARERKDFKESDRLRDQLVAMGVVLKDSKAGTTWEVAR